MRYSIPTMGVCAVGKDMARTDRFFKLATRIIAEMAINIPLFSIYQIFSVPWGGEYPDQPQGEGKGRCLYLSHEVVAVDIEDAIRMNADCMAVQTFIGADGQLSSLDNLNQVISAGMRYSIPTMGVYVHAMGALLDDAIGQLQRVRLGQLLAPGHHDGHRAGGHDLLKVFAVVGLDLRFLHAPGRSEP